MTLSLFSQRTHMNLCMSIWKNRNLWSSCEDLVHWEMATKIKVTLCAQSLSFQFQFNFIELFFSLSFVCETPPLPLLINRKPSNIVHVCIAIVRYTLCWWMGGSIFIHVICIEKGQYQKHLSWLLHVDNENFSVHL